MKRQATMRRLAAGLAVAATALGLAGCAPAGPTTSVDGITVSGEFGAGLTVEFPTPLDVGSTEVAVLQDGAGDAAAEGDTIRLSYALYNGTTGDLVDNVGLADAETTSFTVDDTTLPVGMSTALEGVKAGEIAVAAIPSSEALGDTGSSALGLDAGDPLVFVFEITKVSAPLDTDSLPSAATGEPVAAPEDFPTVTKGPGDSPVVTIPDTAAPQLLDVDSAVLRQGDGQQVLYGSTVYIKYVEQVWDSGDIVYSSWDDDSVTQFTLETGGDVLSGLSEGLLSQKVGSRVMLLIPSDKAYGSTGDEELGVPADATIVITVDILAIE